MNANLIGTPVWDLVGEIQLRHQIIRPIAHALVSAALVDVEAGRADAGTIPVRYRDTTLRPDAVDAVRRSIARQRPERPYNLYAPHGHVFIHPETGSAAWQVHVHLSSDARGPAQARLALSAPQAQELGLALLAEYDAVQAPVPIRIPGVPTQVIDEVNEQCAELGIHPSEALTSGLRIWLRAHRTSGGAPRQPGVSLADLTAQLHITHRLTDHDVTVALAFDAIRMTASAHHKRVDELFASTTRLHPWAYDGALYWADLNLSHRGARFVAGRTGLFATVNAAPGLPGRWRVEIIAGNQPNVASRTLSWLTAQDLDEAYELANRMLSAHAGDLTEPATSAPPANLNAPTITDPCQCGDRA